MPVMGDHPSGDGVVSVPISSTTFCFCLAPHTRRKKAQHGMPAMWHACLHKTGLWRICGTGNIPPHLYVALYMCLLPAFLPAFHVCSALLPSFFLPACLYAFLMPYIFYPCLHASLCLHSCAFTCPSSPACLLCLSSLSTCLLPPPPHCLPCPSCLPAFPSAATTFMHLPTLPSFSCPYTHLPAYPFICICPAFTSFYPTLLYLLTTCIRVRGSLNTCNRGMACRRAFDAPYRFFMPNHLLLYNSN